MSITPQAFYVHLQQLAGVEKYLIAYSGGIDSHVLLHLCARLKNSPGGFKQSFSAVYIDHGLSSHAKQWGIHCQQICFSLDIPLTLIEVDAQSKNGQSPEAAARTARYQAFKQLLTTKECLLTAQHLDDQAETLMLQLLRGSGTRGLAAMPKVKSFARGLLARPMLAYRKQHIIDYARIHQLDWIEDESNHQQCIDRNYLRHTIFPLLAKRWPAVAESFAKSAENLSEAQMLQDEMAAADIQPAFNVLDDGTIEYDKILLDPLVELLTDHDNRPGHSGRAFHYKNARLNNILRYWINLNNYPLPSKKILAQIVENLILARQDAMPVVCWRRDQLACELRRYQHKLYLLKIDSEYKKTRNSIAFTEQLIENKVNSYSVSLIPSSSDTMRSSFPRKTLFSKKLTIAYRQGGERFRKRQGEQSHLLKHWFQQQAIPPWERDCMPLIFWGDELIQIGNTRLNYSLNSGEKKLNHDDSLIIRWQSGKN